MSEMSQKKSEMFWSLSLPNPPPLHQTTARGDYLQQQAKLDWLRSEHFEVLMEKKEKEKKNRKWKAQQEILMVDY